MSYFDFQSAAREAGILPQELERICRIFRDDYPHDDMLFELHVLRACMAVAEGRIQLKDLLAENPALKS